MYQVSGIIIQSWYGRKSARAEESVSRLKNIRLILISMYCNCLGCPNLSGHFVTILINWWVLLTTGHVTLGADLGFPRHLLESLTPSPTLWHHSVESLDYSTWEMAFISWVGRFSSATRTWQSISCPMKICQRSWKPMALSLWNKYPFIWSLLDLGDVGFFFPFFSLIIFFLESPVSLHIFAFIFFFLLLPHAWTKTVELKWTWEQIWITRTHAKLVCRFPRCATLAAMLNVFALSHFHVVLLLVAPPISSSATSKTHLPLETLQ